MAKTDRALTDQEERRCAMAWQLAANVRDNAAAWRLAERLLKSWGMSLVELGVPQPSDSARHYGRRIEE